MTDIQKSRCPVCGKSQNGRSDRQNRYMWSVVYKIIADETGHSTEVIHDFMMSMFLPRSFITVGKAEQEVRKSTTELSTVEMEDYLMRIRVFAAQDLQCQIPLPNEPPN